MDWLGDQLDLFYGEAATCFHDPWAARDAYVDILVRRDRDNIENFLKKYAVTDLDGREKSNALKLLEMQKNAQFIFTSCGWFFDDVAGIETVQVLRYAARAIQFAEKLGGPALERGFRDFLEDARGNRDGGGAAVYDSQVTPARIDPLRVGAHYSISSLFEDYPEEVRIYCYTCAGEERETTEAGRVRLATGKVRVASDLTLEEKSLSTWGTRTSAAGSVPSSAPNPSPTCGRNWPGPWRRGTWPTWCGSSTGTSVPTLSACGTSSRTNRERCSTRSSGSPTRASKPRTARSTRATIPS
jgi:hypothetical protein